jgi:outer membrane lipoprotein-sorting protein
MVKKLLMFLFLFPLTLLTQEARQILKKMEDNMRGNSAYAEMDISIVRPRFTREMSVKSWTKGEDYSMILITAPARDRGTIFLKRQKEIWNYVPAVDRLIKLPPSMMSQSWMGTDFSNDDLVRESSILDDYTHQILRTEKYNNYECYVIEMMPKPESAVVWGKVLVWITKEDYINLRTENYDERNKLINVMQMSEITPVGNRKVPFRLELIPQDKQGQKTVMVYTDLKIDLPVEDDFFSIQNIKKIR